MLWETGIREHLLILQTGNLTYEGLLFGLCLAPRTFFQAQLFPCKSESRYGAGVFFGGVPYTLKN